jgi:predicted NAD/FAD-dependent oxidoreductase
VKRIVIVGAGFAGLAAAKALRHADVEVFVVPRNKAAPGDLIGQSALSRKTNLNFVVAIRVRLRQDKLVEQIVVLLLQKQWIGHSSLRTTDRYSHTHQELEYRRLAASKVGLNFIVGPNGPKLGSAQT